MNRRSFVIKMVVVLGVCLVGLGVYPAEADSPGVTHGPISGEVTDTSALLRQPFT